MGSTTTLSNVNSSWIRSLWSSLVRISLIDLTSSLKTSLIFFFLYFLYSSAVDTRTNQKVAIKKLARPFQSAVHAKRTYRELRMLKHMNHENVR